MPLLGQYTIARNYHDGKKTAEACLGYLIR